MFEWFNNNQGSMSAILSLIGLSLSFVAICISINVSRKQNKIALFQNKFEIYKVLRNWHISISIYPIAFNNFLGLYSGSLLNKELHQIIDEILETAGYLFSKPVLNKLQKVKYNFEELEGLDSSIEAYLSDFKTKYGQEMFAAFREELSNYFTVPNPSEYENEFKEYCGKKVVSCYVYDEVLRDNRREVLNFYDLYKARNAVFKEISDVHKDVLNLMKDEIKPL